MGEIWKGEGRGKNFRVWCFFKNFLKGGGEDFEEKFFLMMVSENFFSTS